MFYITYQYLETSGAPVHKLYRLVDFDGGNSGVHILRYHVPPVEQAHRHILPLPRVTLHHLVARLEARLRDLVHGHFLVVRLLGGDDGGVGGHGVVDPRVGDQVCLELVEIDVEGAVEAEGGGDGGDDLGDETVEVGVGGPADVEVCPTDVVDCLVGQSIGIGIDIAHFKLKFYYLGNSCTSLFLDFKLSLQKN